MTQEVALGVRLTGESDDYVSAIERAESAGASVQAQWDAMASRGEALAQGLGAISAAASQGQQVLDALGVSSDGLLESISNNTAAQEAFAAATGVAEGLLGALGVQAQGYSEVLDGARALTGEFTDALADGSRGAADAAVQLTQMGAQMRFAGVTAEWTSGALGKLKLAFLGVFAVFAVINIAKQLYEESEAIQKIVARIVTMFKVGWSYVQEANDVLVAAIETKFKWVVQALYPIFANFAERVGQVLSYIPGLEGVGERLNAFAADLRKRLENTRSFEERLTAIQAQYEAVRAQAKADGAQKLLDIERDFANRKGKAIADAAAQEVATAKAGADELDKLRRSVEAAWLELRRATLDSAFALERDAMQREQAELQRALQARFISERDYVVQASALKQAAAAADLQRVVEQQAEMQARVATLQAAKARTEAAGNEKAALEIEREMVALQGRLNALLKEQVIAQRNVLDVTRQRAAELDAIARKENDALLAAMNANEAQLKGLDERLKALDLEASLRGKSTLEQRLLTEAARIEGERRREIAAAMTTAAALAQALKIAGVENVDEAKLFGEQLASINAKFDEILEKTRGGIIGQSAFDQVKQFGEGLTDAIVGAFEQGRSVADAFRNYLKASFNRLVLRPLVDFGVQGLLGTGGGGGGLLGSLLGLGGGGGGGLLGSLGSVLGLGGNTGLLSSVGGWLAGGAETGFMAGFGSFVSNIGSLGFTGAISSAFSTAFANFAAGGLGGLATGLGSLLGPIGIIVGILAATGVFNDKTGIKIDNSVRDGRGRRDIITGAALGDFDVSGDLGNEVFAPLIAKVKDLDEFIAKNLLSEESLARVRENIQRISSDATDWFGFDDEASAKVAIEKASKLFLQQRYATAFDEIDASIARTIRTFEGGADELVAYLSKVVALNSAFEQITTEVPFLNLSFGAFVAAGDEARETLATLAATIKMSGADIEALANEAIAASRRTLTEQLTIASERVLALADAFDGSLAKAQAIAQAEAQRLQMLQQLLVQIATYSDEIGNMFANSAESFRMATMDASQKYEYFDQLAAQTFAELRDATDPTRIRELSDQYNRYLQSAFSLLSAEQQRDVGGQFADLATRANEVAQAQLAAAREAALEQSRQLGDDIRASIAAAMALVAKDMMDAAEKMQAAADTMANTANRGITVTGYIDLSDGRTVPLDVQAGAGI